MIRDLARLAEMKKFAVGRFQVPAVMAVLAVLVGIQKAFLPNEPLATSTTDGNYHRYGGRLYTLRLADRLE